MMDLNGLDLDIGNNDFFGGLDDTELGIMKKGQQKQGGNAPVNLAETTQKLTSISKQALEALEKDYSEKKSSKWTVVVHTYNPRT